MPAERMAVQRAKELLIYLAQGLVDLPEEVSVEQFEEDDGTVVLELAVAQEDYGKVIGRGGRTAQALRTLVRAAAAGDRSRETLTSGEHPRSDRSQETLASGEHPRFGQRRVVLDIVD